MALTMVLKMVLTMLLVMCDDDGVDVLGVSVVTEGQGPRA